VAKAYYIYKFGPFRLDPKERTLLRRGKPVPLAPKLFDTLLALVERSGQTVSRKELIQILWPDTFVAESNLAQNIFKLRKALEDAGKQYIETVSKTGYRFIISAKVVESDGAKSERIQRKDKSVFDQELEAGLAPITLAALPFRQLKVLSGDNLMGLAMADAIITRISRLHRISLIPTSTILKYADRQDDALTTGRKLGADVVLDGTLQHSGEWMQATVQLIGLGSGRILWADKYNEQVSDPFALQDKISEQVAKALISKLGKTEQRTLNKPSSKSIEAYAHYIKGRFFWNKRTEAGLKKSIEYFERATAIDPDYALAYTGIADSYSLLAEYLFLPPKEAFERALSAARRAVEIDSALAEAHASLAEVRFFYKRDWSGAEEEFKKAIALNPNCAAARHLFGWFLLTQERFDEALKEFERAQNIDPLSLVYNTALGQPFFYKRQYDRAIRLYKETIEMDQNFTIAHYYLGTALLHKRDYEGALSEYKKVKEVEYIEQGITLVGYTLAVMGRREDALWELEKLKALSTCGYVSPFNIALLYAGLGDVERAFEWLERALNEEAAWLVFLKIEPGFANLRSDPRFTQLLVRAGFEST
jgi:DNA-binding winged helix-turn-helix (wHTH) protein/Tfp pilus assembly protein PilF